MTGSFFLKNSESISLKAPLLSLTARDNNDLDSLLLLELLRSCKILLDRLLAIDPSRLPNNPG